MEGNLQDKIDLIGWTGSAGNSFSLRSRCNYQKWPIGNLLESLGGHISKGEDTAPISPRKSRIYSIDDRNTGVPFRLMVSTSDRVRSAQQYSSMWVVLNLGTCLCRNEKRTTIEEILIAERLEKWLAWSAWDSTSWLSRVNDGPRLPWMFRQTGIFST